VALFAENIANSRLAKQNRTGHLERGVATTIKGREAQARKEKKEKLAREKKERELIKLMGAGYTLKNASSKKLNKQQKAIAAKEKHQQEQLQLAQDKIDFAIPIVGLDQVMQCDGRSEVSRLLVVLTKRQAMVRVVDKVPTLDIQLNDGSTKYPVNMVIKGELARSFGDEGYKVNKVMDIRDCVAIMRAVRGQPRRIQVEMVDVVYKEDGVTVKRPATSMSIASERLTKHTRALMTERDDVRARGGIPIEEMIEEERMALPPGGTPVTEKTFFKWLEDRQKRRVKEAAQTKANATKKKRGNFLTGKALFAKNSDIFVDDEAGAGADVMSQRVTLSGSEGEDEEEEGEMKQGETKSKGGGGGGRKGKKNPAAPSTAAAAATIQVGGQKVNVGDTSVFLDGDDDDLDLDDLDDD
jgi:hypothetical protein